MNKKGLFAVLGSVCLLSVGLVAAVSSYTGRNQSLLQGNAIEPNPDTCEFSVRNEGGAFNITTSEHRAGGYFLDVQSGNYEQWQCGLANFNYPGLTEGQTYYCEFELTVNVNGATAGGKQYCDIRVRANENKPGAGEGFKDDFQKDVKFIIGTNFTALASNNDICLQLGALRDSNGDNKFTALIERFVIKKGNNVGEIVRRVDFESGVAFANRWKAANAQERFFCTKENVENYIYDYYSLYSAQRTNAGAIDDVEGNRTIAETIEYLVAYHKM